MKSISRWLTMSSHSLGLLNSSPMAMGVLLLLAQMLEVSDVFRGERIFQEEHPDGFQVLGQLDGHDGGQQLVDVGQQLDLFAEPLAQLSEKPGKLPGEGSRLPDACPLVGGTGGVFRTYGEERRPGTTGSQRMCR